MNLTKSLSSGGAYKEEGIIEVQFYNFLQNLVGVISRRQGTGIKRVSGHVSHVL